MSFLENRRLKCLHMLNSVTGLPRGHLDQHFRTAIELAIRRNRVTEAELLCDIDSTFGVLSDTMALSWRDWLVGDTCVEQHLPRPSPSLDFKYQQLLLAQEVVRNAPHLEPSQKNAWIQQRLGISAAMHLSQVKALRRIFQNKSRRA